MIKRIDNSSELQLHDGITMYTFSSSNCIPCKYINPIVDKVASNNTNIHIYRIDSTEFPALAEKWNVKTVPTVFIFYNKELKYMLKSILGIKHRLENIAGGVE